MLFTGVVAIMASFHLALVWAGLPDAYETFTGADKQTMLWNGAAYSNAYTRDTLSTAVPGILDSAKALLWDYVIKAFKNEGDEMEEGRIKILHPLGAVAKVQLEITDPNATYTGVFKTGGPGIARLSWAKFDPAKVMPGVAVKILIDGNKQSQNFHMMRNLDGQGEDQNFFKHEVTHVYPDSESLKVQIGMKVFARAISNLPGSDSDRPENVGNLGLYEQASVMANGTAVKNVVAPYKIELRPSEEIVAWQAKYSAASYRKEDFRTVLAAIPEGTVLYDLIVVHGNKAQLDNHISINQKIGRLVTKSKFVASEYGDKRLFFQHAHKRWQA